MDENGVSESCLGVVVEAGGESLYPMYFGIACALFAFKGLSEKGLDDQRWFDIREKMLKGGARLLELLVWRRVQRQQVKNSAEKPELVEKLEREIQELKRRRSEDGRANERVVSIYAAQEQRWFGERKSLRQHIGALLNELRILNDQICEINTKNSILEEEGEKKRDLEERLKAAETLVEELREAANQEAQVHASELWKHKSAFIELVSNHRQLQAELGRADTRVETAKQHLDFVFEEKQELFFLLQNLSLELETARKDSEHKDKILSAMLRKSKLDTEEKQILLKEVKLSKARMKQHSEMNNKWRMDSESKCERHTLTSMLRKQVGSRLRASGGNANAANNTNSNLNDYTPHSDDECLAERDEELDLSADVKQVDGWVCLQAGKYRMTSFERKHQQEIEAFSEQIRVKDEKLEAYHWRSLSMELESKQLSSQLQVLNESILQLRHDKLKLEMLLVERETELKSLKDSIAMHLNSLNKQRNKLQSARLELPFNADDMVKVAKRKTADKAQEADGGSVEPEIDEETEGELKNASSCSCMVQCSAEDTEGSNSKESPQGLVPTETSQQGAEIMQKEVSMNESLVKERSLWKMDIHALGVSYKIKRLKQQLVMLERLKGKQGGDPEDQYQIRMEAFQVLLALLNKQVTRYHSLQEKTDDLCKRMREKDLDVNKGDSNSIRTKQDSKTLEHFLEETFQLQRFIVATGQKLMEIHTQIASGFTVVAENLGGPTSFEMRRFSDNLQGLFREVQRGIGVRIARIIGDLEGTLASDGIRSCRQ